MKWFLIFLFLSKITITQAQFPLKYQFKHIEGQIYGNNQKQISVEFRTRRKLIIQNCEDANLDTMLRSLALARQGRKQLEFLLTTSAKINLSVSEKIGLLYKDGKYYLIGGISGPENTDDNRLITNKASRTFWMRTFKKNKFIMVYRSNTIELFKGAIEYVKDSSRRLTRNEVKIFDWKTNKEITEFSMDTICIEQLVHPEMMYRNYRELYYFAGLHEIFHITPENIMLQELERDSETDAMRLERKAFKHRVAVNRKNIIYPKA